MLRRPKSPIGARGVMQMRTEKGANGAGGACRAAGGGERGAGSQWARGGVALPWGRGRRGSGPQKAPPPYTRRADTGQTWGKTGKRGKRESEVAELPVRDSRAGNERERKRHKKIQKRYKRDAGKAVKMCLARASLTPCGVRAREEDGSAVKTRTGT